MTTQTINSISFKNEKCVIFLNEDKTFSGRDMTDPWNEPRMYTKNTRSFKRGVEALKKAFDDNTTMYQVAGILNDCGLNARTYCSVD
jgi:hypothetical protein